MYTGTSGVMSTLATPAFHPGAILETPWALFYPTPRPITRPP